MKSGVYTIVNKLNNKIYVGESIDVKKRLTQHKSDLKNGRHPNLHLQRSVNQEGIENFEFQLLEHCNEEFLKSFENYWCNLLDAHNPEKGYNFDSCDPNGICRKKSKETRLLISEKAKDRLSLPSNNPFYGKTHSAETREIISKVHKGKRLSEEHKYILKASHVRGADHTGSVKVINTETGYVYNSIKETAEDSGINKRTLRDYLRGNIKNKTKFLLYDEVGHP